MVRRIIGDERREHNATRSKRYLFLLLAPNSRRVRTVLLSLLVSDLHSAMPSEVEILSKSCQLLVSLIFVYGLLSFFLQTTLSKWTMYALASTCALQLAAYHPFRNVDELLPQMGVYQYHRLRVGGIHRQTAVEVVICCVSHGTAISPYGNCQHVGGI